MFFFVAQVDQTPARSVRLPLPQGSAHGHEAGIAVPAFCHQLKALTVPRHLGLLLDILHSKEERLVAKPEREVFEKGRARVDLEPALQPVLKEALDVIAGRFPRSEEIIRGLGHRDFVHQKRSPRNRAEQVPGRHSIIVATNLVARLLLCSTIRKTLTGSIWENEINIVGSNLLAQ